MEPEEEGAPWPAEAGKNCRMKRKRREELTRKYQVKCSSSTKELEARVTAWIRRQREANKASEEMEEKEDDDDNDDDNAAGAEDMRFDESSEASYLAAKDAANDEGLRS